jgi:hypothetical protein
MQNVYKIKIQYTYLKTANLDVSFEENIYNGIFLYFKELR